MTVILMLPPRRERLRLAKSLDEARVAQNMVHTSATHASRIILPVIAPAQYAR